MDNGDTNVTTPPPDYDAVDDTRARSMRMEYQVRELRREVGALTAAVDTLIVERARSEGAAKVWRIAGGLAATVAITLGGFAYQLATTAASDHVTVARHEVIIESMRSDVSTIRIDVAAIRATLDARRGE